MSKKLSYKQKLRNKRAYKQIRKAYNSLDQSDKPADEVVDYKYFKRQTIATAKAKNISVKEATKRVLNSENFVSPAERSRNNLIQGLKESFKDEYKQIQQLSRDAKGRYISIHENLKWDKDRKAYTFTGVGGQTYIIDTTNSPLGVYIYAI